MAIAEMMTRVPEPTRESCAVTAQEACEDEFPRRRLFTRDEYYKCAEMGIFDPDERLELIEGEILRKVSPQARPHMAAITRAMRTLQAAFGPDYHIMPQGPMNVSEYSEPEPDLLVVRGLEEDYPEHPRGSDATLVVEVSNSTLRFDRRRKAALYARAGVVEYWVVSLPERCLHVHRGPRATGEYAEVMKLAEGESIAPLGALNSAVTVVSLLPTVPAASSDTKE